MAEKGENLHDIILRLAESRGPEASFTPDEVAREMWPAKPDEVKGAERWRALMRPVRAAAVGLARQGEIDILRRKVVVDAHKPFKGVYRLRLRERPAIVLDTSSQQDER